MANKFRNNYSVKSFVLILKKVFTISFSIFSSAFQAGSFIQVISVLCVVYGWVEKKSNKEKKIPNTSEISFHFYVERGRCSLNVYIEVASAIG